MKCERDARGNDLGRVAVWAWAVGEQPAKGVVSGGTRLCVCQRFCHSPTDDLSFPVTVRARDLHVCVHAREDLGALDLDSLTVAASTSDDIPVRRGSRSSAVVAEDVLVQLKLEQ